MAPTEVTNRGSLQASFPGTRYPQGQASIWPCAFPWEDRGLQPLPLSWSQGRTCHRELQAPPSQRPPPWTSASDVRPSSLKV